MFGANAFGWPYFAEGYAGVVSSGTVTITPPSGVFTYQGDGASLTLFPDSGGQIQYAGDDPVAYPVAATNAIILYTGDDATLTGAIQTTSGVIAYQADAPITNGPLQTTSGAFRYLAANPTLWTTNTPTGGQITWQADTPTVYPVTVSTGKIVYKGDAPLSQPQPAAGGRILWTAAAPNVFPLTVTSTSPIRWKADNPTIFNASYVVENSGVILWRMDVPTVTPLTEPVNPPPPPPGTNMKISVTL